MMTDKTKRRISLLGTAVFLVYLAALVYFLFFAEQYGRTEFSEELRINLQPFREIVRFIRYRDILGTEAVVLNVAGNVVGFMPFGLVLPMMHRYLRRPGSVVAVTALFSLCVELVQLATRTGSFDIDDLILNTLGGLIGFGLFALCNLFRKKYYGET